MGCVSFVAAAVPAHTATAPVCPWLLPGAPLAVFATLSLLPAQLSCKHLLKHFQTNCVQFTGFSGKLTHMTSSNNKSQQFKAYVQANL